MGVECSDLCRCLGCHNCKDEKSTEKSVLGKRRRHAQPLKEICKVQLTEDTELESQPSQPTYIVRPRRAKENRYMKFGDYAVEVGDKKF